MYGIVLACVLVLVVVLSLGCLQKESEEIVPPMPTIEYEVSDHYHGILLDLGSDPSDHIFTLKNQSVKIIYDNREGEIHFLTLTVNNRTEEITASPSNCVEIGASEIRNKEGFVETVKGICVFKHQLNNVIFVIYPVSTTKDKDGDGLIGEDPRNEIDDDKDGRVDEDPYPFYWDYTNWDTNSLQVDSFIPKKLEPGYGGPD